MLNFDRAYEHTVLSHIWDAIALLNHVLSMKKGWNMEISLLLFIAR